MSRVFVSAQEVAERAGVSRSAVSRTFTPGASVSAETRRKVLEAAEALGYHVNQLARGLMRNESGIVCLIVSEMGTPYRSALIRAITQQLQLSGKIAMLINTDRSDGSVDLALRQAIRYRADASIILSGLPDKRITQLCLKSGQRLVLINRDDDQAGPLRINLNDAEAAQRIVTAFVRAGCRRLGFANSQAGTPSLVAREIGFVAAARSMGMEVTVARFGHTGYESGRVLAQRLLTLPERPDGVFCATDLIACGFMDAARQQFAVGIPEQLCVAGFDDIEQASWTSYDLTTFAQPVEEIARQAVGWLSQAEEGEERIQLRAELIWRSSIRAG
ncbi:substrate-binding domain-containing protein [Rhizobium sp. SSA_523]|uniref:LacI family DNA-binding transcriptional regulator n=1 Tax=Rhizobium sp. SSA_523 TaxID=2952477 RepID=UPI0020905420|nr:substrate-binding domain-containing protein [Rhizobium sp. SSA_523]MCO5731197.1 substrate-binding domain-containing protein [Rhizobium sp. SSA_523]WKC22260.1 substrate-binding domain-containing protein [Rhizobium sp. SSA_523]